MNAAEQCKDLASTARFLGFAPQHIFFLVENTEQLYVRIQIPKHSDPTKTRDVDIPNLELKGVQKVIYKNILNEISAAESVHSYVTGKSIITAARELCPGKAVLKIDIKDFFPSITFPRVFGLFKSLGFNHASSFILSKLTTFDNRLPQGAPTSPAISNFIMRSLDKRLLNLATEWEMNYLRYSDDMFFYKSRNFNHPRLSQIVSEIIGRSGFQPNPTKTKYHPKGLPRITLGLLTHGSIPQIPGPQRHKFRSLFFKASRTIHWAQTNKEYLLGVLEWYKSVNGKDDMYLRYREIIDNVSRLKLHDTYKSK